MGTLWAWMSLKAKTHDATNRRDTSPRHVTATGCCNKSPRVTSENHCHCDRILSLQSVAQIQTGLNLCDISQRQTKRKRLVAAAVQTRRLVATICRIVCLCLNTCSGLIGKGRGRYQWQCSVCACMLQSVYSLAVIMRSPCAGLCVRGCFAVWWVERSRGWTVCNPPLMFLLLSRIHALLSTPDKFW